MNQIQIHRDSKHTPLQINVHWAQNIGERMRGLINRPPLNGNEGMLISPCSSVHTFGMQYALDLVFLDANRSVIKLVCGIRPNRFAACIGAKYVLELAAGSVNEWLIAKGQRLVWGQNQSH